MIVIKEEYYTLEDNVRHTYMSVVWSHKIQEKQVDIFTDQYKCLETIRIVFASLTSFGLISLIFTDQFIVKLLSTLISFVSTLISLFFKSFDTQKNITDHKSSANELLIMRDKFKLLLLEIKLKKDTISNLLTRYEMLLEELGQIYKNAPNTTDDAVKRASKALKINKDNEFTDEEIDLNLPETLKRR